jgi:hypothetical protein
MTNRYFIVCAAAAALCFGLTARASAQTAEICGNSVDDDADGFADVLRATIVTVC